MKISFWTSEPVTNSGHVCKIILKHLKPLTQSKGVKNKRLGGKTALWKRNLNKITQTCMISMTMASTSILIIHSQIWKLHMMATWCFNQLNTCNWLLKKSLVGCCRPRGGHTSPHLLRWDVLLSNNGLFLDRLKREKAFVIALHGFFVRVVLHTTKSPAHACL